MEISAPNPMGFSGKNLIINGNFVVNQRGYASSAAVGAVAYTLDRWRDGNGGNGSPGGFTFAPMTTGANNATSPVDVVVTVPAGSTLQQPIEPLCLSAPSQPYTLSWAGTATGTLEWYDGSTYQLVAGSSPLTIVIPPNVSTYVQFSNGTVSDAQLETGTTPTPFERRHPAIELALCQRYFEAGNFSVLSSSAAAGNLLGVFIPFKVTKRAIPTMTLTLTSNYNSTGGTIDYIHSDAFRFYTTSTASAANIQAVGSFTATSEVS